MNLFVFPIINAVLYPGTAKPLNIFEPRYIEMVEDSLSGGTPIGLAFTEVAAREELKSSSKVPIRTTLGYGTPLVLEHRSDGSYLILLQARGKAQLNKTVETQKPYLVYDADSVGENNQISESRKDLLKSIQQILFGWISRQVDVANQEEFSKSLKKPEQIVGYFSTFLVRDPDVQQMILEENQMDAKLDLIWRLVLSKETMH